MVSCLQAGIRKRTQQGDTYALYRSIDLQREVLVNHIGLSRALVLMVTIGLALVIMASLAVGVAVCAGIAPAIDQLIMLGAQHRLLIHSGSPATCTIIPNPP